jgi:predicted 3-demethylubiquinone-9 3-methyltransferase (glyoxalase superfamily)
MMIGKPTISTFLWFERNAEAAAELYTTLFPDSRITHVARAGDGGPGRTRAVMTVSFELAGHRLTAINGGPHYTLTPAMSLVVSCETQDEMDHYWHALIADGGTPSKCGWLVDRFGLSWQVIPSALGGLLTDADPAKAARVGQALMAMDKLDLAALRSAHRGDQVMAQE